MIIGIDGYEANVSNRVGIGQYAYEILWGIYRISQKYQILVFLPSPPNTDLPPARDNWQYVVTGSVFLWTLIGLPRAIKKHPVDVFFSPTHYIPRFTTISRVMSVMDLSYMKYPQLFKPKDLYQLRSWTAYSARHATRILTISEASRNDIIKEYHVPERRVIVTYPGFRMKEASQTSPFEAVREKYGIGRHFILSVGTIQPRKNYVRLIEAFSVFLKANKQKFSDIELIIIGKRGWLYEDIFAAPAKYGIADRVRFLDFVPDEDLAAFYAHALCFALPSLYEGFGLPVLEAMAHKCPVVVSDISSLPEIAGKAAVYVKPTEIASIVAGLLIAVRQRNLIQGRARIAKGLAQVNKFSWEKAAKQTLSVLTEVGRNT